MNHHGASLELIGLTISIHVLGMYGFAPLVGMLVDRIGPRRTAAMSQVVFILAGSSAIVLGDHPLLVEVPLFLLGLAWSLGMITGSAEVSGSVPSASRVSVQGFTDTSMNLAAALAALVAGPLLGTIAFSGLGVVIIAIALAVLLFIRVTPTPNTIRF